MNRAGMWMLPAWIALAMGVGGCESSDGTALRALEPSEPTLEQVERLAEARGEQGAGNYDVALAMFQEVLAENPTITTAYLGIGDIYMIRQDYGKAEPAYGRAARLEPRNFDAQYGHGLALQLLARFVEAVRAYHRALTIDPDNLRANLNLATTYLQMNEPHRAVVFAERAVHVDPEHGPARANVGAIYEKLARYEEAVDAYDTALELMGNRGPLMMNQINVLARLKRYTEAANTAETLIRIEPSATAYERLGWCTFRLRDYERSMDSYRAAVQLEPGHWPALNGVGVNALNTWLLSKKRDEQARIEARNAFRRSLRANSDQPRVVELMLNYGL
jgi:tetratricopeptide (TPR) repeat protein